MNYFFTFRGQKRKIYPSFLREGKEGGKNERGRLICILLEERRKEEGFPTFLGKRG